jgi:hypothetical protein
VHETSAGGKGRVQLRQKRVAVYMSSVHEMTGAASSKCSRSPRHLGKRWQSGVDQNIAKALPTGRHDTRRIAENIAKLPELLRKN